MKKPAGIVEVQKFIFEKLVQEYGCNVLSETPGDQMVIDTKTSYYENSAVRIDISYFH